MKRGSPSTARANGANDEGLRRWTSAELKAKKKCCRSKPRCKRCPVVLHQVRKAERNGIRGKDLTKVFKRARRVAR